MKAFAPAFILFLSLTLSVTAQGLSKTEKKISKIVSTNTPDAIEFLEQVVNINSGSLNLKGVREVGAVFREGFDAIGFETEWEEMPAEMNRAGHLVAKIEGNKGKKLLLIGHLDTVFEENSPFQTFEKLNDSIALAPGGNDMKGGDVMILYALKALYEAGALEGADIQVVFTGDEESTGKPLEISRASLISAAKRADIALGYETSTGFDYATVARRGASGWHLVTEGRRAHSSGVFSERTGAGAIFEMSRILNAFYTQVRGEYGLTFNAGNIQGGTAATYEAASNKGTTFGKTNVVPSHTVVHGGIRALSVEQLKNAKQHMQAIVAKHLPHTEATLSFDDSYPPMAPTEGNKTLALALSKVNQDLGRGAMKTWDPLRRGAADIAFVAPYTDALAGLGALGKGGHTPNESLQLDSMALAIKRAAILMLRLSKDSRDKGGQ